MGKEEKAVAKVDPLDSLPADVRSALVEDAATEGQRLTQDQLMIPLVRVIQPMTRIGNKAHSSYIEGAELGYWWNNVTMEVYPTVEIVPLYFTDLVIEWGLLEKGGGLKKVWRPSDPQMPDTFRDDKNRDISVANPGRELQRTLQWLVLITQSGGKDLPQAELALLPAKRTELKVIRRFNSLVTGRTVSGLHAKPYWFASTFSTQGTQNEKGSWFLMQFSEPKVIAGTERHELWKHARDTAIRMEAQGDKLAETVASSLQRAAEDEGQEAPAQAHVETAI